MKMVLGRRVAESHGLVMRMQRVVEREKEKEKEEMSPEIPLKRRRVEREEESGSDESDFWEGIEFLNLSDLIDE